MKKSVVVLYLVSFFIVCVVADTTHAAYSVTPLVVDVEAKQRDVIRKKVTIINDGPAPITVYPSVNNISLDDGGTIEAFLPPVSSDRTTSLSSWIEINRAGTRVMPGESHEYELTLRINHAAKPGTYHAIVGFGSGRNDQIAREQVEANRAPKLMVTVTIVEEKNELLKLSRFIVDRFITSGQNQAAVYTIKNPGDAPLVPTGEIIFYNSKGEEVGSTSVNIDGVSVAPGEEHEFNATVPSEGLFGKYKAFLSVEYGNAQLASVQDTAFFYVLPLKKLLIILGVLSVLTVVFALMLHRRFMGSEDVDDDSDRIALHVYDGVSESCEHDINLKQNDAS